MRRNTKSFHMTSTRKSILRDFITILDEHQDSLVLPCFSLEYQVHLRFPSRIKLLASEGSIILAITYNNCLRDLYSDRSEKFFQVIRDVLNSDRLTASIMASIWSSGCPSFIREMPTNSNPQRAATYFRAVIGLFSYEAGEENCELRLRRFFAPLLLRAGALWDMHESAKLSSNTTSRRESLFSSQSQSSRAYSSDSTSEDSDMSRSAPTLSSFSSGPLSSSIVSTRKTVTYIGHFTSTTSTHAMSSDDRALFQNTFVPLPFNCCTQRYKSCSPAIGLFLPPHPSRSTVPRFYTLPSIIRAYDSLFPELKRLTPDQTSHRNKTFYGKNAPENSWASTFSSQFVGLEHEVDDGMEHGKMIGKGKCPLY